MPLSPDQIAALRSRGVMQQADKSLFTFRLASPGGDVSADRLASIAELAGRFGSGRVHFTTRQGVEIPDVPDGQVLALCDVLDATEIPPGYSGPVVRGVVACPGQTCRFGLIDTQGLAREIQGHLAERGPLPHKFKIALTGCANRCAKPQENDLGVMGSGPGRCKLTVGGRMGRTCRLGDELGASYPAGAELLAVIDAVIDWYATHGQSKERFGATIDRVGLDSLTQSLPQGE
jgi:dissimilatory sulfite reductase (desulfoviridin) alpha/beta subunit